MNLGLKMLDYGQIGKNTAIRTVKQMQKETVIFDVSL
jgi:hypothetical protein